MMKPGSLHHLWALLYKRKTNHQTTMDFLVQMLVLAFSITIVQAGRLTLSILDTNTSRRQFEILYSYFCSRKQTLTLHAQCLLGDHLHDISLCIFWEK